MLTKRQNLMETIKGGNPDRFVNQYEFMNLIMEAPLGEMAGPGQTIVNGWGITFSWPADQLGGFPVHDAEHKVLKDITDWKNQVKAPVVATSDEAWAAAVAHAKAVDRNEEFVTAFVAPGVFEMTHHLMSMEDALMALYEEPEDMHDLIDYLVDYELAYAKELINRIHPDCIFHHDDWGSQRSSFVSPEMFAEFFLPAYKKIYGFYKENGVELIVHHSDSYGVNLVPFMIDMGIDIWQGVMTTNNVPELIEKYGKQIAFMGAIDSGVVDFPGWTPEIVAEYTEKACKECGKLYFIPNLTQGLNFSSFPGVYEETTKVIDQLSKEMF
ncbi:uroporphyrinogen decarboxylase family protein [Acetobacterium carbinolicum]|jgi:uroporphyrinogen-III decarboxylase|uniref:uroporphyrinogen decarboxylase family protein n=1 Tax=Acetobacterium TaxID=33951 RepID=UPI000DBEACCF|nr:MULTISPECIES: uroporphyrinogen decarboxylase family protein [unclassified Acetobacterium]AWW26239.1 uroporphyrinogen decarboxylase [Acetobacterium sp. KB-1]MDZ5723761.1 uroporphyrinogen decarboxylase family protein [Acetobacterium sp. K1/6]